MSATLALLGDVGFEALRIDEVAQRSGVNKTTIYRRWPTRDALVHDALMTLTAHPVPERTGDLRQDLVALLSSGLAWLASPVGRGVARALTSAPPDGVLRQMLAEMRAAIIQTRIDLIAEAIADGRLPAGTDARLLAELVHAGIYSRIVKWEQEPDAAHVRAVVEVVLAGAEAGAAVRR